METYKTEKDMTEQAFILPDLGPNAKIYGPWMSQPKIQEEINSVFHEQESNQFGEERYALMFVPGTYNLEVNVGYYTQVLGLGASPDSVTIKGHVQTKADFTNGNALCNFWRVAENLFVDPNDGIDHWAVSQAAPYRKMHLKGVKARF